MLAAAFEIGYNLLVHPQEPQKKRRESMCVCACLPLMIQIIDKNDNPMLVVQGLPKQPAKFTNLGNVKMLADSCALSLGVG